VYSIHLAIISDGESKGSYENVCSFVQLKITGCHIRDVIKLNIIFLAIDANALYFVCSLPFPPSIKQSVETNVIYFVCSMPFPPQYSTVYGDKCPILCLLHDLPPQYSTVYGDKCPILCLLHALPPQYSTVYRDKCHIVCLLLALCSLATLPHPTIARNIMLHLITYMRWPPLIFYYPKLPVFS
jgi:hypothetical protein